MKSTNMTIMLGAAALVCGCEAKIGTGDGNASNGQASAEGKAEEGKVAFSAPGFNFKLSIPLDQATTENEGKILYPGAKVTGLYIAANPGSKRGHEGEVELRFATPDPPDRVAAWYRDPARAGDFTLGSDAKEGAAVVIAGTRKDGGDGFKLRLEPKASGTDGRLMLRDHS
jgi:hypothetical protein